MFGKSCVGFGLMCLLSFTAFADAAEITASGEGKALIGQNISVTREESLKKAKRAAVAEAVKKMNGPEALIDPKVQAAIDQIAIQIGNDKIADQSNSKDGANNFVSRVTIRLDETEFRKLLQDNGVASTVARNHKVMIVMDEFFTTKTDHAKPLRELVEYSHDKTATASASLSASEKSASVDAASSRSAYAGSADVSASQSSSAAFGAAGRGGAVFGAGKSESAVSGSVKEKSQSASDTYSQSASAANIDQKSASEKKDVVNFKKLVEYQPQNKGPEKNNYTYAALVREANKYDLSLLDSDMFRSKYFPDKQLTMEEMQNSPELARFVAAARENEADYFMVGNTIIINNDKSTSTGTYICDGLVTLKAYATKGAETIATDARSESATGASPDQCRVNVANKLAGFVGTTLGSTILNFWKMREMYGEEYNIRLVSLTGNLSDDVKDSFAEAVESIGGLKSKLNERKSTRTEYEVSITYKGDKSVARSISSALSKVSAFAKAQRKVDGSSIKYCLEGPCPDK